MPLACAIVMSLILIFSAVSEYLKLQIIEKGVRNALQTSIISVATQNYDDVDTYLDNLLGLKRDGAYHIKIIGKEAE